MKKYLPFIIAGILVVLLCGGLAISLVIKKYKPTDERADLNQYFHITAESQVALVLNGQLIEEQAILVDGENYIEFQTLHNLLDDRYYWDANESKLLYTTADVTYMAESGSENYYKGNKKKTNDSGVVVKLQEDRVLVSLSYIKMLSTIDVESYDSPRRLVIETADRIVSKAPLKKDSAIRIKGGIKSKILADGKEDDTVVVVEKMENWSKVMTQDGVVGFVKNSVLDDSKDETIDVEEKNQDFEHELMEESIVMAWHQVTNTAANGQVSGILSQTKGINVLCPTWFYLNNSRGGIQCLASKDYVNYCHSQGVSVWGLVSNLEDQTVDTTQVLTTTSYRENLVSALIAKAIEYKLDGINVDIEAVKPEVGDGYIQFIRELSLKCHANGIILSVDNYVPTEYTAFYRRKEQSNYADYVVIMAYDEHYAGSEAGSVSSIGFVKDGVENTMKEVPADQIILGLPFYTRVWELTPNTTDEGEIISYDTKSQPTGMRAAKNMASANGAEAVWNEDCGQYFVQYENGGKTYQIWLEEEESIELKLKQAVEHEVAGVSFWKLGFEENNIWNTVIKYIQ